MFNCPTQIRGHVALPNAIIVKYTVIVPGQFASAAGSLSCRQTFNNSEPKGSTDIEHKYEREWYGFQSSIFLCGKIDQQDNPFSLKSKYK